MRRLLCLPLALLGVLVVVAACGGGGPPGPGGSGTPAPSATEPVPSPTEEIPIEYVPASWRLCENPIERFAIGHPADWFTGSIRPSEVCGHFHPEPFRFTGEYPMVALAAAQTPVTVTEHLADALSPTFFETLLREDITVLGHPAVRYETRALGGGLLEPGMMFYGYAIDRDGRAFLVWTSADVGETRYEDWKGTIETAVDTLQFR